MKSLVLLSVVTFCGAQLADPFFGYVPWVQPRNDIVLKSAESTDSTVAETRATSGTFKYEYPLYPFYPTPQVVSSAASLHVPNVLTYLANPFYQSSSLNEATSKTEEKDSDDGHPLDFLNKPLMYYGSHLNYVNQPPLPYHYSPFVFPATTAVETTQSDTPVQEPASISARKKRDIRVPLPLLRAVPFQNTVEYKTHALEATDDDTAADTTKLKLTSKTHEVSIPSIKYVQDVVSVKPVTYKAPLVNTIGGYYPYHNFGTAGYYPSTYTIPSPYQPLRYTAFYPHGYGYQVAQSTEPQPEHETAKKTVAIETE